jgi:predicted phage baseplate assembly protein
VDFDFLPKLPKSDLDDRTFRDLVDECILRIPRYCPEWTNHNPGDPGITFVELFAWLTDQMLLRFNQVPRRNYIAFLELLGIQLQPPAPARTELTFYLTKAQPSAVRIPYATEVATERTETEEAVIFSTDRELSIGNPRIKHFLTAEFPEARPSGQQLYNRFRNSANEQNCEWGNIEESALFEQTQPGNCFYLVLEPDQFMEEQSIEGNVLAITFKGAAATPTGINPDDPPREWQAWNGEEWQPTILRRELDDRTKGFSFSGITQQGSNQPLEADIILHLPQRWSIADFGTNYRGHWLRCAYKSSKELQPTYSSSPRIIGLAVRSIGGTVGASQCIRIENESLGISNGKAGQAFQLQMRPILERREGECIQIVPPGEPVENWQEVPDFADSGPDDRHYMIDSLTGTVQFGPLIREPAQLKQHTQQRAQIQPGGRIVRRENGRVGNFSPPLLAAAGDSSGEILERQYGKVPPPGSEIYMVAYRTGGGRRGNVQAEKLKVLKSAIPYVKSVVNYEQAYEGTDAESLDEAVIRVPQLLRTRECAVTPEDFENVAKKAHRAVARAHCLTDAANSTAGLVRLLIVPQNRSNIDPNKGMNPDKCFALDYELKLKIENYMRERKPLGIQVRLQEPEYVGVSVQTEVALEPQYNNPRAQEEIRTRLLVALYRFLNPLTGGIDRQGWPLGRPVSPSDILALCQNQKIPGLRYLGVVKLFELRKHGSEWLRTDIPELVIEPGPLGLMCSWEDENPELRSGHVIDFID